MRVLLPLLLLAVCACRKASPPAAIDPLAQLAADPWFRRPPPDLRAQLDSAEQVTASFVPADQTAAALVRLADSAFVQLSAEEARSLLGVPGAPSPHEYTPSLLRCVVPSGEGEQHLDADRLIVRWRAGTVFVTSTAMREKYRPLEHRAVVAQLPAVPLDVFVDSLTAIY